MSRKILVSQHYYVLEDLIVAEVKEGTSVFFYIRGGLIKWVLEGQTVNQAYHLEVLQRERIGNKRLD